MQPKSEVHFDFPKFKPEWNELALSSPESTLFQLYEWNASWWKAFGKDLRLITLRDPEGQLLGIAPLMVAENSLQFVGTPNYSSDYAKFIVRNDDPSLIRSLTQEVLDLAKKEGLTLRLLNIPAQGDSHLAFLSSLGKAQVPFQTRRMTDTPALRMNDLDEVKELLGKKSMKRHFARLKSKGLLRFENLEKSAEVEKYLPVFFEQHQARRTLAGGTSLFDDPSEKEFYRSLATELGQSGQLRFGIVWLDSKAVAFHFGFEFRKIFYWYKPSFSPEFKDYSPGEVLLKFLLEDCLAKRVEEFDFTVGEEAFKYRFANRIRSNARVDVFLDAQAEALELMKRKIVKTGKSLLRV